MVIACWSSKGGSGTTVVAASLGRLLAETRPEGALLVDLVGDVAAVLGWPEPGGPGVAEWLAAGESVPADGLARIEHRLSSRLALVTRGASAIEDASRAPLLVSLLETDSRTVVVDCGTFETRGVPSAEAALARAVASAAAESLLVVRPCYLAMRGAVAASIRPSGVVVVDEPERALDAEDIGEILHVPVVATVPCTPSIARAVDAGLLGSRPPGGLTRALRRLP